jgi:two-component system chemotaxis response regulator CheB
MTGDRPLRVVLADDSAFMRALVGRALTDAGFDVVGRAVDGADALERCRELRPDVLTLDLAMPGLGGLDVLARLGTDAPSLPVVVVSAFSPADGARAVDALTAGAFDLVAKPAGDTPLRAFADELAEKVRAAAESGARSRPRTRRPAGGTASERLAPPAARPRSGTGPVLAIASSTGGPRSLAALLPRLRTVPAGGVIVQHMPPGFTRSLAERLDRASAVEVREARDGDRLRRDLVLVAPGGMHLRFDAQGVARLTDEPAIGGLRPRADLTISDLARLHGERLLLLVLTGMGRDGELGAQDVRRARGAIWAEHESTCAVYGMPRAVVEGGLATRALPIEELAGVAADALAGARQEVAA